MSFPFALPLSGTYSEINQVLKELWQCTYRGNDIDSIAICSDHAEGASELGAGRQKKQYSYRLVMMQVALFFAGIKKYLENEQCFR
jgi:hypothetical protein